MSRLCLVCRQAGRLLARELPDEPTATAKTSTDRTTFPTGRVDPYSEPETAALELFETQTGTDTDAVSVVRLGDSVESESGQELLPVLLESAEDDLSAPAGWEWTDPSVLFERTPAWVWEAYDELRPTIETVTDDTEHGSTTLSIRALELLRDEALAGQIEETTPDEETWSSLVATAERLSQAHPSMMAISNRISRVINETDSRQPAQLVSATQQGIRRAIRADTEAASTAAEYVTDRRVATLSRSGTVLNALKQAQPPAVLVAESRPGREGVSVAETLAGETAVTLTTDAAFPATLRDWEADCLLLGADTVTPDGRLHNKAGTYPAAAVATRESIPVAVVTATAKLSPHEQIETASRPDTSLSDVSLYDGDAPLDTHTPTFEMTPADCLDVLLTERGEIEPDKLTEIVTEWHR